MLIITIVVLIGLAIMAMAKNGLLKDIFENNITWVDYEWNDYEKER